MALLLALLAPLFGILDAIGHVLFNLLFKLLLVHFQSADTDLHRMLTLRLFNHGLHRLQLDKGALLVLMHLDRCGELSLRREHFLTLHLLLVLLFEFHGQAIEVLLLYRPRAARIDDTGLLLRW